MNMWNTMAAEQVSALGKALFMLETLAHPEHESVLNYLLEHQEATLLDLIIATGMDSDSLEEQLDLLCQTGVVQLHSDMHNNFYLADNQQIKTLNRVVRQLVQGE